MRWKRGGRGGWFISIISSKWRCSTSSSPLFLTAVLTRDPPVLSFLVLVDGDRSLIATRRMIYSRQAHRSEEKRTLTEGIGLGSERKGNRGILQSVLRLWNVLRQIALLDSNTNNFFAGYVMVKLNFWWNNFKLIYYSVVKNEKRTNKLKFVMFYCR